MTVMTMGIMATAILLATCRRTEGRAVPARVRRGSRT